MCVRACVWHVSMRIFEACNDLGLDLGEGELVHLMVVWSFIVENQGKKL